jgi:hypothetical protein
MQRTAHAYSPAFVISVEIKENLSPFTLFQGLLLPFGVVVYGKVNSMGSLLGQIDQAGVF